jgi:hypothetical protein
MINNHLVPITAGYVNMAQTSVFKKKFDRQVRTIGRALISMIAR